MKRGYYALDVHNVTNTPVKYEGRYVASWRHKQIRDSGREVWYFSGDSRWNLSPMQGVTRSMPKPKLIQLMELTGAI